MGRRLTGSRCSHGAPNTHSVSPNTDRSGAAHHPLPPYRRGGRRRQRRRGRAAGRSGSRPRASSGRASPAAGRGQSRGEAEGPGAVSAAIPGPGWGREGRAGSKRVPWLAAVAGSTKLTWPCPSHDSACRQRRRPSQRSLCAPAVFAGLHTRSCTRLRRQTLHWAAAGGG